MKKLFLNDKLIFYVIFLNTIVLFLQETGINLWWLNTLDLGCTVLFVIEMVIKHLEWGTKKYWSNGWNIMDGILTIISIPSIFAYIWPNTFIDFSFLLVLRLSRIFRMFRLVHLFPNFTQIMKNVGLAMRQCFSIFVGFGILLFIFSLISCAIFHDTAPDYFGTPLESFYSVFKMCTVEGWYEIPDAVTQGAPSWSIYWVRLYFSIFLISMGILGMSIINSIFVDAMVSNNDNNNDEIMKKLNEIEQKLNK